MDTMIDQEDPELFMMGEEELTEKANRFDIETSLDEMEEWPKPSRMKVQGIEEEINYVDFMYIDNEDGFWDEYLDWKEEAYAANDWLYSRPYFKH